MAKRNKEKIEEYLMKRWSEIYGKRLSMADVNEINDNLEQFIEVMGKIERYIKRRDK